MELYPLKVFLTVATERSFSRAGEKLLRTQPAISIAIQRLESDLKEKLIDRSGRELLLTDAGRVVLEYARRFQNLESELENALRELKDNYAGRLSIGANESTCLYLIQHNEGVAFLPRMCVEQEIRQHLLHEIRVKELNVERKIRLVYPARRALSHAAKAFLEVVKKTSVELETVQEPV